MIDLPTSFTDIFNVLNAGAMLQVNHMFASNPATNAWIDGRYVRFGTQMSF